MKKLKELLAAIGKAAKLAEDQVKAGEHHLLPVYKSLMTAGSALNVRVQQIESSESNDDALAKARELEAANTKQRELLEVAKAKGGPAAEKPAVPTPVATVQDAEEPDEPEPLGTLS